MSRAAKVKEQAQAEGPQVDEVAADNLAGPSVSAGEALAAQESVAAVEELEREDVEMAADDHADPGLTPPSPEHEEVPLLDAGVISLGELDDEQEFPDEDDEDEDDDEDNEYGEGFNEPSDSDPDEGEYDDEDHYPEDHLDGYGGGDHFMDEQEEEEEMAAYEAALAEALAARAARADGAADGEFDNAARLGALLGIPAPAQTFDEDGHPVPRQDAATSAGANSDAATAAREAARREAILDATNAAMEAAEASGFMGGGGGAGFRALQSMMSGMSSRLRGILTSLRDQTGGASKKLVALQDLAELLSVSTEDTLAGYFQVEAFATELITILKGAAAKTGTGEGDEDDDDPSDDEDEGGHDDGGMTRSEMLAFGIDPATQGSGGGGSGAASEEKNVQMMLLACRCLANLMEALPGSSHAVVYCGAVPVLCAKLMEIQYIDLAEQTMIVSRP